MTDLGEEAYSEARGALPAMGAGVEEAERGVAASGFGNLRDC